MSFYSVSTHSNVIIVTNVSAGLGLTDGLDGAGFLSGSLPPPVVTTNISDLSLRVVERSRGNCVARVALRSCLPRDKGGSSVFSWVTYRDILLSSVKRNIKRCTCVRVAHLRLNVTTRRQHIITFNDETSTDANYPYFAMFSFY